MMKTMPSSPPNEVGASRERFVARRIEHETETKPKAQLRSSARKDEDLRKHRGSRAGIERCTSRDPTYISSGLVLERSSVTPRPRTWSKDQSRGIVDSKEYGTRDAFTICPGERRAPLPRRWSATVIIAR